MNSAFTQHVAFFTQHRVVGVVRAATADLASQAAEAAIVGGIKILEVPFTTPGAIRVISDMRRKFGERVLIGAGAVTTLEAADRVIKANAQFIVFPHTNGPLIEFCCKQQVFAVPGAATPTEIISAAGLGAPLISICPARQLGGPAYISALRELVPDISFLASGTGDTDTVADYLNHGAAAVEVGDSLFQPGHLANQNFPGIAECARDIMRRVQGGF